MRLKLPKSNVAWEITDNGDYYSYDRVSIRASYAIPGGDVCYVENHFDKRMLESADQGFADHVVEKSLQMLEREVGRKMVRG